MNKIIDIGVSSRDKLIKGINKLADAVVATLGPGGRNAIYSQYGEVRSTKDGVTVAKNIILEDPIENLGASLIKQAASKTADKAGDGTTTSTLLAQKIINLGVEHINNGGNAVDIKRGMELAVDKIIDNLNNIKEDISSEEQLKQVANISSNSDPEIGSLISEAIKKVGREGSVHIEESKSSDSYLEIVEGLQFDRGYKSHFFVTNNNTMTCQLENPVLLITDYKINQVKELLPILERISSLNKSLVIIAEDIDGEALSTLIVNKLRGTLKCAAVKAPDFGDRRKLILEDIATLTGGQVVTLDKGMKFTDFDEDWFGNCGMVTITKDQTTIVDGKGDSKLIEARIESLKQQIDKSQTPFEKEKIQERLAKMVGGVAVVYIGGNTETEIKEKKDRAEDALYATKAAIEDGILPGGGVALIHASKNYKYNDTNNVNKTLGEQIIIKAIQYPFIKILTNAGYEISDIYSKLSELKLKNNNWIGYDLGLNTMGDMKLAGIIDPTKVTKSALLNALSVASTTLLTECVIADKPDESNKNQNNLNEYI